MTPCTLYCGARFSFSVSVIIVSGFIVLCELVEAVLVDGPCELDVDPDWRGGTDTGG